MSKRGKHKSATKDLDRSIRWLEGLNDVKKVVLGRTESCRHSFTPGHVRCKQNVFGGFKANGYSGNGVIDLFVRCDEDRRESLRKQIQKRYKDKK